VQVAGMEIEFVVNGEPRPKQSFRSTGGGRGYTPARIKAWQAEVGWAAQQAMRTSKINEPFDGNVLVDLTFYLGDNRRVDGDNLSKGVLDGLNGICWNDDRQVVDLHIKKIIANKASACVVVRIAQKESIE
jgi:crossover junction endodeoxyribonuclease RusA